MGAFSRRRFSVGETERWLLVAFCGPHRQSFGEILRKLEHVVEQRVYLGVIDEPEKSGGGKIDERFEQIFRERRTVDVTVKLQEVRVLLGRTGLGHLGKASEQRADFPFSVVERIE